MVELSWSSVAFLYIVRHGVDLDFISFSFVGGLRGAEPLSLFWGLYFLHWFLITETQNTF